jgi:hypothetical protein
VGEKNLLSLSGIEKAGQPLTYTRSAFVGDYILSILSLSLSWRYTTHSGCVFYSPLLGFSLLAYEVT